MDGSPLLRHRLFWPNHLLRVIGRYEPLSAFGGVTPADVRSFYDQKLSLSFNPFVAAWLRA